MQNREIPKLNVTMWHLLDCCMVIWLVNGNIGSNTFVQGTKIIAVIDIIKVLPLCHWCVQYTLKLAGLWLPGFSQHFDTVVSLSMYTNFLEYLLYLAWESELWYACILGMFLDLMRFMVHFTAVTCWSGISSVLTYAIVIFGFLLIS